MTAEQTDIDRWWNEPRPPRSPALRIVEVPAFATTITITCRACDTRATVDVDWPGLLCGACRFDLDATEAKLTTQAAALQADGDRDTDAWLEYQAALSDDLSTRWINLVQARDACKARLDRTLAGKRSSNDTADDIQSSIDTVRAAWAEMEAKVQRTQQNAANPLASLLKAEALYKTAMKQYTTKLQAIQIALAEIAVIRGELPL